MEDKFNLKIPKIKDEDGIEHMVAFELPVEDKVFVITTDKKVFEKGKNGKYLRCLRINPSLEKALTPPKSLDLID